MLEHGADLHLGQPPQQVLKGRLPLAGRIQPDQQVPARVAEAALARRLTAEVAVVVHDHLVVEELGHRVDVALDIGDHAVPIWSVISESGSANTGSPSAVRAALAANDATALARPVTLR